MHRSFKFAELVQGSESLQTNLGWVSTVCSSLKLKDSFSTRGSVCLGRDKEN